MANITDIVRREYYWLTLFSTRVHHESCMTRPNVYTTINERQNFSVTLHGIGPFYILLDAYLALRSICITGTNINTSDDACVACHRLGKYGWLKSDWFYNCRTSDLISAYSGVPYWIYALLGHDSHHWTIMNIEQVNFIVVWHLVYNSKSESLIAAVGKGYFGVICITLLPFLTYKYCSRFL